MTVPPPARGAISSRPPAPSIRSLTIDSPSPSPWPSGLVEKKGWVKSYVGEPSTERGGRRRRHYLMDTPGEHALGRSYRALKKMTQRLEDRLDSL